MYQEVKMQQSLEPSFGIQGHHQSKINRRGSNGKFLREQEGAL